MTDGGALRVLLVEDEASIAKPLARALEDEGYLVTVSEQGAGVPALVGSWEPDIVLLDLALPDLDGIEVARGIRETSQVPIIMVTARGAERDRIRGLETGADDYIVKPFGVAELVARIRANVRRARGPATTGEVLSFRGLTLDPRTHRVVLDDAEVSLSAKEYELLRMLMLRGGAAVRRDDLARGVWNASVREVGKSLDVHVSWLRRKLGDDPNTPTYIATVRGVGFRLAVEPDSD